MLRRLAIGTALICGSFIGSALALGLGEIEVSSRLNQPFTASIPLTSLTADESQSLQVRIAPGAEFERAGIERNDYLSTLKFDVVGSSVRISSSQSAREPFLSLLVEARSGGGRVLREYTVLLDPPSYNATPRSAAGATAAAGAPRPAPAGQSEFYQTVQEAGRAPAAAAPATPPPAPLPAPAPSPQPTVAQTPAAAPATGSGGGGVYGPVLAQETFWSIATRLRANVPGATMDQLLLSVYEANRGAFVGGINGLQKGVTLQVPPADSILATDAATAKSRVAALRGQRSPAAAAPPRVAAVPKPKSAVEPEAAPEAALGAAPAEAPRASSLPPPPSSPVRPEAPAQTPAPAPAESAVPPPPMPEPGATAEAPATESPAAVEPSAAEAPAPVAPPPAPMAAPAEEEPDLMQRLLVPVVVAVLLLLLLLLAWRFWKRSREARAVEEPPQRPVRTTPPAVVAATAAAAAAAAAAKPAAAASDKSQFEKLQDTLVDEEKASRDAAPGSFESTQQIDTQQLRTQRMQPPPELNTASALPDFDSTQIIETPPPAVSKPVIDPASVDFDVTAQFAADTLQIDLEANDPIAEADFHLAYGLYDEAALLLRQAAEKEPRRTDLRVKLAETYFAAGRPVEFQETAEQLKPQLSAQEWQKLAILGRQLCPDAALFKGGEDADLGGVDLAFDEPEEAAPAAVPPPAPAAAPASAAAAVLDFSLEELELPPPQAAKAEERKDEGNLLEFDLSEFDLAPEPKPADGGKPAEPALDIDLDLGDFDLGSDAPPAQSAQSPSAIQETEIKLEDFDLGEFTPEADSTISSDDEVGTKLDLARAYVDMGDNEMARSLLGEVAEQGSETQKAEAQTLLARLPA